MATRASDVRIVANRNAGVLVSPDSRKLSLTDDKLDTAHSNMDLPILSMPSSGWALFFVTLWPGLNLARENIHILTRGQGIQGATSVARAPVHPFQLKTTQTV